MDNWVVFLLVNVILVIVLGVITNLVTPWVKSIIDKSIFSSRQNRINAICREYRRMKDLKEDNFQFMVTILLFIAVLILGLVMLVGGIGYTMFTLVLSSSDYVWTALIGGVSITITVLILLSVFIRMIRLYSMVQGFDAYKETVKTKIGKLGGNPEDLDKEEENAEVKPSKRRNKRVGE